MRSSDEGQQRAHEARVRDLFERHALQPPTAWRFVGSTNNFGYRNRIRLKVHADGQVGFFNRDKHGSCRVLSPSVHRMVERTKQWAQCSPRHARRVDYLEVRGADLDGRHGLFVTTHQPATLDAAAVRQDMGHDVFVAVAGQPEQVPSQRHSLDGELYGYVPLDGFMQVNHAVNALLREHLVVGAAKRHVRHFVDLYCGAGNLSLPLLQSGCSGVGVENQASAIDAARRAASEQGLDADVFRIGDASADTIVSTHEGSWDLVVSNPPRAGMRQASAVLERLKPRHVALCYCNPESLVRDVAQLSRVGYRMTECRLFNMFPHTRHVEIVAWLERTDTP